MQLCRNKVENAHEHTAREPQRNPQLTTSTQQNSHVSFCFVQMPLANLCPSKNPTSSARSTEETTPGLPNPMA